MTILDELSKPIVGIFKGRGLKCTPQRLSVYWVINNSDSHLTINEIHERVKNILPGVGLATIYRSLETLERLNMIEKVHLKDGCHSFSVAPEGHKHSVICVDCNRIIEIGDCPYEQMYKTISRSTGFIIQNHFLQLFGKCRECQT